jgi:hypothetical protein
MRYTDIELLVTAKLVRQSPDQNAPVGYCDWMNGQVCRDEVYA